jgi:hypothetical protein
MAAGLYEEGVSGSPRGGVPGGDGCKVKATKQVIRPKHAVLAIIYTVFLFAAIASLIIPFLLWYDR